MSTFCFRHNLSFFPPRFRKVKIASKTPATNCCGVEERMMVMMLSQDSILRFPTPILQLGG